MNKKIKNTIKKILKVDEIRRYRRRVHIEQEMDKKQLQYEKNGTGFHTDQQEPFVSIIITQKSDSYQVLSWS